MERMDLIVDLRKLLPVNREHFSAERFLVLQDTLQKACDLLRRKSEAQIKLNHAHLFFRERRIFLVAVLVAGGSEQALCS